MLALLRSTWFCSHEPRSQGAVAGELVSGHMRPRWRTAVDRLSRGAPLAICARANSSRIVAPHAGLDVLRARRRACVPSAARPDVRRGRAGRAVALRRLRRRRRAVPSGGFDTPFGSRQSTTTSSTALLRRSVARPRTRRGACARALARNAAAVSRACRAGRPIVPLLMGYQTARPRGARGRAGRGAAPARRCSSPARISRTITTRRRRRAWTASSSTTSRVSTRTACSTCSMLEPEHACGGGPTVAVMRAARRSARATPSFSKYADSGDVSGDKSSVVGYMAAALGNFGTA